MPEQPSSILVLSNRDMETPADQTPTRPLASPDEGAAQATPPWLLGRSLALPGIRSFPLSKRLRRHRRRRYSRIALSALSTTWWAAVALAALASVAALVLPNPH